MKITIFTLFPEMVEPFFTSSIMKRAVEKGIITYNIVNFRDYAKGVHRKSDDEPFGGGAGMVLMHKNNMCFRKRYREPRRWIYINWS